MQDALPATKLHTKHTTTYYKVCAGLLDDQFRFLGVLNCVCRIQQIVFIDFKSVCIETFLLETRVVPPHHDHSRHDSKAPTTHATLNSVRIFNGTTKRYCDGKVDWSRSDCCQHNCVVGRDMHTRVIPELLAVDKEPERRFHNNQHTFTGCSTKYMLIVKQNTDVVGASPAFWTPVGSV